MGSVARLMTRGALLFAVTVVLSGCDIPGLSTPKIDTEAASDGQLQLPEKTAYQAGQAVPSTTPTPGVPLPSASSKAPTTSTPETSTSRVRSSPTCAGRVRPGVMSGLDVVPSSVSAEVTWLGAGSTAKEYLVAAIPQTLVKGLQPPIDWKTVPATPDCGTVTTTVTGLTAGTKYIFWLRMVTVDPIYGGSHDTWVARSLVITAG